MSKARKAPLLNLARRKFSEEIIKRRRIALVSLSLVLSIFALAGGRVKSEATMLNLPMEFGRPYVLLLAAWVIWVYFLYRYLLVAAAPWAAFVDEITIRAMNDERVRALSLKALDRIPVPAQYLPETLNQLDEGYRFSIIRQGGVYHFSTSRLYLPAMQFEPTGAANYGLFPLTNSEVWTYRLVRISATLKAMILENTFSDDVLPLVLVVATPPLWLVFYWKVIGKSLRGLLNL